VVEVLFFSSPIGLGHATRDSAIAKHFDNISTKFITGNVAAKFLRECGFIVEDVYSPPKFKVEEGSLKNSLRWLWDYYNYYKDCKKICSEIIKIEKPKMVVSDEDFASITVAQQNKIPTVIITDVLETRFLKGIGSLIEKKMNYSMKNIMKKCDAVIIPENGTGQKNMKRVGPIVRSTDLSRENLREKFSFKKKTIVTSIGGTDAGEFLIEKVINVLPKIKEDVDLVIVSGPSLNTDFGKKTRNLGFVNNLHEIIYAADLVVSLAGKSTIDESKAYGTPGIFIPIKGHFEQEDNAKDEGYSFNDIYKLESLIQEKILEKREPANFSGARKTYEIIREIIPN